MAIKIDASLTFDFDINGVVYKLSEPTVEQMEIFISDQENDQNKVKKMYLFLESLGLPINIAKSLGMTQVNKIVEALTGELSAKK